jgi:hypothetical protein
MADSNFSLEAPSAGTGGVSCGLWPAKDHAPRRHEKRPRRETATRATDHCAGDGRRRTRIDIACLARQVERCPRAAADQSQHPASAQRSDHKLNRCPRLEHPAVWNRRVARGLSIASIQERAWADAMIGRSGFHGMLRNMKTSPWTRRSLTERFLLNRSALPSHPRNRHAAPQSEEHSPSASLTSQSWMASISSALRKRKRRSP